jgi:hypothetical protein
MVIVTEAPGGTDGGTKVTETPAGTLPAVKLRSNPPWEPLSMVVIVVFTDVFRRTANSKVEVVIV